jgi:ABC-type spermidine/putrescine transport system permease subunit II
VARAGNLRESTDGRAAGFVAGQTLTFPLWVYGAVKVGIPPQVFVMGTLIFVVESSSRSPASSRSAAARSRPT